MVPLESNYLEFGFHGGSADCRTRSTARRPAMLNEIGGPATRDARPPAMVPLESNDLEFGFYKREPRRRNEIGRLANPRDGSA